MNTDKHGFIQHKDATCLADLPRHSAAAAGALAKAEGTKKVIRRRALTYFYTITYRKRLVVNNSYIFYLPYIFKCDILWQNDRKTMNAAYVTSKGQLVVPSRIRRLFGIKPGTRINFVEEGDRIIFQPVTREYIDYFCGIFKLKPGEKSVVQELLEERRAEKEKEDRE